MDAQFTDIDWTDETLSFQATVGERSARLWVRLPEGTERPSDDLIAVFMAILAGPNPQNLQMELRPSGSVADTIETFCNCELKAARSPDPTPFAASRRGHAVSFSGGFDSLAALATVPAGAHLVSMDFGGWFERERDFFLQFSPNVVTTNFRQEGFERNSWLFMLAGVVLLRDHLDLASYTAGSIFESTPWNYRGWLESTPATPALLQSIGLTKVNTVNGLTEVATTLLAMRHFPSYISDSLRSLAAPGSGKSVRKQMLVSALYREGRASLPFEPDFEVPERPPLRYGQSLADDTLMPYIIQRLGRDQAMALMSEIPSEMFDLADSVRLRFYDRYQPAFYTNLPRAVKRVMAAVYADAGIDAFLESDWRDYRHVVEILRSAHNLPE